MNTIKIIDKNGCIVDEFSTEFNYKVGEIINVNNYCKCKCILSDTENNNYVFVKGWIEFGF